MLHIAAGVCLGIVAAVYLLNWLGQIAAWRAERRERKAYRKMLCDTEKRAQQAQIAASGLQPSEAPAGTGVAIMMCAICVIALAFLLSLH